MVLENYRHPDLLHSVTKRKVELDIYVPSMKLAFEYQGAQHETQTYRGDIRRQKERDNEKVMLCKQHGITLICIPHHWSGLEEDLVATIAHHRPDIQLNVTLDAVEGQVVPSKSLPKPSSKQRTDGSIPFAFPATYHPTMDPTDWQVAPFDKCS
jgi:hypothetical protein